MVVKRVSLCLCHGGGGKIPGGGSMVVGKCCVCSMVVRCESTCVGALVVGEGFPCVGGIVVVVYVCV